MNDLPLYFWVILAIAGWGIAGMVWRDKMRYWEAWRNAQAEADWERELRDVYQETCETMKKELDDIRKDIAAAKGAK